MRIEHIHIANFRRFKHVELELPDGVTALVGRNGAGKSTVLEAIGWCLYGNDAARTGKDLIKRRGAAPHEDVRVQVAFRLGAQVVEVTRELLGKNESHSASVAVDDQIVVAGGAQSAKESTAYLARLLHMDREAFFTSLVARQRELAALTDASPAARKRILIGLLRLDALDAAITEARARRRDARSQLSGLRSAMLDATALREEIASVKKLLEADGQRLIEQDALIVSLVDVVEETRTRREASRKLSLDHRALSGDIQGLDERLTATQAERERRTRELATAREAAAKAAEIAPRLEGIPIARDRVERLAARAVAHAEHARLAAEAARADIEAAAAAKAAEGARAALAAGSAVRSLAQRIATEKPRQEAALLAQQRRVADLEAKARESAKQLNEIGGKEKRVRELGPESPCPTCTRPLHEHHGELLHVFGTEMETLRASVEASRAELGAEREKEAALRDALAQLATRDTEIRGKLERLAADDATARSATARVEEAQARALRHREAARAYESEPFDAKELEGARVELAALERTRDQHARLAAQGERERDLALLLSELEQTHTLAFSQRGELALRRDALGFDQLAHDALEKATERSEARLSEARIQRERLVGERALRTDQAGKLAATLAQQEDLATRAKTLEGRVMLLEELAGERDSGLLPEFKDHLIGRIRPLLSLHAGRLFRDLTEGRYADLEVDDSYDLIVHDEGEAYALERFSGGEADLANLCLRLAVSQVVAERAGTEGFSFLALDEIFGSQDEIRKGNILRSLRGLSGRFRQILLITHIADVKDSAEHVLRVEALDDGTSRIVVEG